MRPSAVKDLIFKSDVALSLEAKYLLGVHKHVTLQVPRGWSSQGL